MIPSNGTYLNNECRVLLDQVLECDQQQLQTLATLVRSAGHRITSLIDLRRNEITP